MERASKPAVRCCTYCTGDPGQVKAKAWSIKVGETRSDAGFERTPIDCDGGRDVLQAHAGAVKQGDRARVAASALAAGDDLAQRGVHVLARDGAGGEGMVQVADLRALLQRIEAHEPAGLQLRVDLRFARIVSVDVRDEGAAPHEIGPEVGAARRCAG